MKKTFCTVALSMLIGGVYATGQGTASAPLPSRPASSQASPWQALARDDIAFMEDWARREHILAAYPNPTQFDGLLKQAEAQAATDVLKVNNFTAYRQTLNHFASVFRDSHFSVPMTLTQNKSMWPGFVAAYVGGHYETFGTDDPSASGKAITACDGKSMDAWVTAIAPFESIIPGLESTRYLAAPLLFRDVDSPFVPRPTECVIDGHSVRLNWKSIDAAKYADIRRRLIGQPDPVNRIEPFGDDGVWITLNNIAPSTDEQAETFRSIVNKLPGLRGKRLIVIDERNNGGGPYNWFMAFIRSLYGEQYADYYARARLQISNVYRVTPEIFKSYSTPPGDGASHIDTPPDGRGIDLMGAYTDDMKRGASILREAGTDRGIAKPRTPGPNPVQAKVIIVTGYGCYSACIGFTDELKRLPGVVQVGTDTGVDSRPGTPLLAPLPSGNGSVRVPTMTRDGRPRGDNEPQKPAFVYDGNIQDTAAVKTWVARLFPRAQ